MVFNQLTGGLVALMAVTLVHLVEEVQTGFRIKFPLGEMPRPVFLGLNMLLYSYYAVVILLASTYHPLAVPLTWPLAIAMTLNGLGHLGIMAFRRAYFPGGWTAPLLILVAGAVLVNLSI
jgi:hypothetical protein